MWVNSGIASISRNWPVILDSYLIEDDDAHDLALDDDDAALVVDADAARVLQDVRTELAHELTVLVVDLDLKSMGRKDMIISFIL